MLTSGAAKTYTDTIVSSPGGRSNQRAAQATRGGSKPQNKPESLSEVQILNLIKNIVISKILQPRYITSETWIHDLSTTSLPFKEHIIWLNALKHKWWDSDNRVKYIKSNAPTPQGVEKIDNALSKLNVHQWFFVYNCNPFRNEISGDLLKTIKLEKYRSNIVTCFDLMNFAFKTENKFENVIYNILLSEPEIIFFIYKCPEKIINSNMPFMKRNSNTKRGGSSRPQSKDKTLWGKTYLFTPPKSMGQSLPGETAITMELFLIDEQYLMDTLEDYNYEIIFDHNFEDIYRGRESCTSDSFNKVVIYHLKND